MLPFPNHSSFLFHPPSSCFRNDLHEVDSSTPPALTSVGSNSLPFLSFETPPPPPDPAPKDRSDGGGGKRRRRGQRNDRHSKIRTAQGLRDRRMRLSIDVASRFFALQDTLGFDKASATVDWLLSQSKSAIEQAAALRASVLPPAVVVNVPACGSSPKSTDSSNSLRTTDRVLIYEKEEEEELQPSSNFDSRRESRAEARARARFRTMEKKKMKMMKFDSLTEHLLFDSVEKVPSLVDNNIPLCMLGYHQSKGHPLIWDDDADVDASYELLPRGMDQ